MSFQASADWSGVDTWLKGAHLLAGTHDLDGRSDFCLSGIWLRGLTGKDGHGNLLLKRRWAGMVTLGHVQARIRRD